MFVSVCVCVFVSVFVLFVCGVCVGVVWVCLQCVCCVYVVCVCVWRVGMLVCGMCVRRGCGACVRVRMVCECGVCGVCVGVCGSECLCVFCVCVSLWFVCVCVFCLCGICVCVFVCIVCVCFFVRVEFL